MLEELGVEAFVVLLAVPAGLLAWAVLYWVRSKAVRLGLVDQPGHRKVHVVPTPLGGGIGIWLGVMGTFAVGTVVVAVARGSEGVRAWLPEAVLPHIEGLWSRVDDLWLLLGAGTVLAVLGLVDDLRGLRWQLRLGLQFLMAGVAVVVLGYELTAFIPVPWITRMLSVLWIVAMINAFNMLDNMDGLSGGVAAIIAGVLGAVMLLSPDPGSGLGQIFVAALLFVVLGALVGFLWHNRPPAKIFMGDAGSYFVGFLVAVATLLATYAGYQESRPHAVLAPLCAMAVPLYDMTTVLWIRVREGRSPFEGDKSHFSHRLVDLGMSKPRAVLTIYLVTLVCGLAALLLGRVDLWAASLVLGIVVCILALINLLERTGWRRGDS
jgi:UDP-GlcNAc:undecaprenyl-phosphate GlcNAc-1-phosphate transferase